MSLKKLKQKVYADQGCLNPLPGEGAAISASNFRQGYLWVAGRVENQASASLVNMLLSDCSSWHRQGDHMRPDFTYTTLRYMPLLAGEKKAPAEPPPYFDNRSDNRGPGAHAAVTSSATSQTGASLMRAMAPNTATSQTLLRRSTRARSPEGFASP